jgi:branched-chain amino acid transport system substrate-binding protein
MNNTTVSVGAVMSAAGLEKSTGVISGAYGKDPTDPAWDNDTGMLAWRAFMKKYMPEGDLTDANAVFSYSVVRTTVQVLKQCGDDLTRASVIKQAASLKEFDGGTGLPVFTIATGADDFAPIKSLQLARFDGKTWVRFGAVLTK